MKIFQSKIQPILTIVTCLHGDEQFGLSIIEQYKDRLNQFHGLQFVIANEDAIKQNKRYIETDLNRSFPGRIDGSYEERLAVPLLETVRSSRFVLDIHNTTSDIRMTPIITNQNEETKQILNLCSSREIAFIQPPLANRSFIGQLNGGVSLEFGFEFSESTESMKEIDQIIHGLLFGIIQKPIERDIFLIDGSISKSQYLKSPLVNFYYDDSLCVFPFLCGERSYPTIHALSATKKNNLMI